MQSIIAKSLSKSSRIRCASGIRRRSFCLDTPATLVWVVRALRVGDARGWELGFPYYGEAAEVLDGWGLYSRCAVHRILQDHIGLALGDELRHRVSGRPGEGLFMLADLSSGCLHVVTEVCHV